MARQTRELYQVPGSPLLNYVLQRISDRLDIIEGLRPTVDSGVMVSAEGVITTKADNSAAWDTAYSHISASGNSHASVLLNNTHRTSAGTDHSDVGLNNSHRTGDGSDHSAVALKTNVLELDNESAFTPDADYEPSTKKYVDDAIAGFSDISWTGPVVEISYSLQTDTIDWPELVMEYNDNGRLDVVMEEL